MLKICLNFFEPHELFREVAKRNNLRKKCQMFLLNGKQQVKFLHRPHRSQQNELIYCTINVKEHFGLKKLFPEFLLLDKMRKRRPNKFSSRKNSSCWKNCFFFSSATCNKRKNRPKSIFSTRMMAFLQTVAFDLLHFKKTFWWLPH